MLGSEGRRGSVFPGVPSKSCARALLLLGLCGVSTGCGSSATSTPAVTDWVYFRETVGDRERYLNVQADGTYESAVLDEHKTRTGTLADSQIEQLKGLMSEAQFDAYLEESASDCEAIDSDIVVQTVRWREQAGSVLHMRGGCWIRMDVENAKTRAFLDTISDMQRDLVE